ncbi:MAG: 3-dehydroquinate synthase [Alphaproteobacteria bacterium]|nr:3-dehydroquinate synthase [Alphaproteobacteria bacterium]
MSAPATFRVELGPRSYDIVVGRGLLAAAGAHCRPFIARGPAIVVTDETVAPLYLAPVRASFAAAGIETVAVVVPAGEESKEFERLRTVIEAILDARPERRTVLVALGGGVVGDLAGFAASIVLRGIDFIQIPTTLLAQVDSAVGGKTGINTRHGKNLVGSFYQPRLVLADTATLASLAPRELRAGYAEVVKYGLIDDAPFFAWCEATGAQILAGDDAAVTHAVTTACRAKARIVGADEREGGLRALLNLGHTFGHALEAETGFGAALLHGEAVALGMALAFDLSVRLGLCPSADARRVHRHLAAVELPVDIARSAAARAPVAALLAHMRQDKKVRDGRLTFILARGIGKAFVTQDVAVEAVDSLLREALAA